jgi:hypothetical protein
LSRRPAADTVTGRIGTAAIGGKPCEFTVRAFEFAAQTIAVDLPALFGFGAARPVGLRLDEPAAVSVTVDIDRATSRLTGKGTLRAPALTVEPLGLQQLSAPFVIQGSQLTFAPTTFVLHSGTHEDALR